MKWYWVSEINHILIPIEADTWENAATQALKLCGGYVVSQHAYHGAEQFDKLKIGVRSK